MADGTVKILTDLSADGFKKGLSKLGGIATTGMSVVSSAIGAASTALGAAGVASIKLGVDFETSLAKASTLFGDVAVDTTKLEKNVLNLSSSTGVAADSIGNSLYNALSAGIPVTEDMGAAMDFMTKNADLARAGFTDIDTAVTSTAKVLNAYKMDVSETEKVHKILMQTQNKGITTVGELGAVLAQVTPTAAAMNVSFEQVGAALASMTAQGTPTAQATTQLNNLFAELGKQGTVASKALDQATQGTEYAGMGFSDLMAAGVPLNEVLNLMGVSAEMSDQALIDLFGGLEAGKSALALSGKNSEQFTSNLVAMGTSADVVGDAVEKMDDTFQVRSQKMMESLKNLGISAFSEMEAPLGEAMSKAEGYISDLADAFAEGGLQGAVEAAGRIFANLATDIAGYAPDMVDAAVDFIKNFAQGIRDNKEQILAAVKNIVNSILNGIGELIPGLQPIIEIVKTLISTIVDNFDMIAPVILIAAAAIGTFKAAMAISETINAVKKAMDSFQLAQKATTIGQALLNAVMNANPFVLIATLIAAVVAAIIYLWNTNEGFREAVISCWQAISGAFSACWNAIVSFFTVTIPEAWNSLMTLFASIPEWWSGIWTTVGQFFADCWTAIVNFFTVDIPTAIQAAISWFSKLPYNIGVALGSAIGNIIKFGADTWKWVTTQIPKIIQGIVKFFSELPEKIWNWLKNAIDKISQWAVQTANKARQGAADTINAVVDWFKRLPGTIWNWLKSAIDKVTSFGSDMVSKAKQAASGTVNGILDFFKDLPDKLLNIGKNLVEGLWNGISNMGGWIWDKISGFCGGVVDGIKSALGIHSPSKVLADEVGRYLPPGIAEGFEKAVGSSGKQMQKSLTGMASGLSVAPVPIDIASQIRNSGALGQMYEAVQLESSKLVTQVQMFTKDSFAGLREDLRELIETAKDNKMVDIAIENVTNLDGKEMARELAKPIGVQLAWMT